MKQSVRKLFLTMLAAGIATIGYSLEGSAQTPIKPGSKEELRAAYATSQDIAEGKRVAAASCASCHGMDGISKAKETPHIAGQRPGYLYMELRVYQSGGRGNTPMNNSVRFLSDDALVKVAAYYANLDPAPPAPKNTKQASAKRDPLAAGRAAAAGCGGCHGEHGISSVPGMPSLVGFDPKYFVSAVSAYKNGQRKHDMMKTLVSAISGKELESIALFYAMQKPAKAKTPSPGDQAAGKAAASACAGCHGEGGVSTGSAPSLAGQDAQYFASAMKEYKNGTRADETMKGPAASVDETAIKNMAAYYANQTPQPPKFRKPLTTEQLAQRCDRCHGLDGNSTDPRSPALAAQRADYLEKVMRAYRKGDRRSFAMTAMLDNVSDDAIAELAAHYSRQKARTVVYVPLPGK